MRYTVTFFALITALLLNTVATSAVQAAPPSPYAVVQVPTLNVRAAPGIDAGVVGQISAEERVTLLGRSEDGAWLRVESATGVSGWIYAELAQTSVPVTALAVYNSPASSPAVASAPSEESVKASIQTALVARQTTAPVTTQPGVAPSPSTAISSANPLPNGDPQGVAPALGVSGVTTADNTPVKLEPLCLPNRLRAISLGGRPEVVTAMKDRLYVGLADVNSLMVVDTGMDMMLGTSRTTAGKIGGVTAGTESLYVSDTENNRLIVTSRQGALAGRSATHGPARSCGRGRWPCFCVAPANGRHQRGGFDQ